jgi:hypothetical protein
MAVACLGASILAIIVTFVRVMMALRG